MYKTQTKITLDEIIKLNKVYFLKMQRVRLILMVLYEIFLLWVCLSAFALHWILLGGIFSLLGNICSYFLVYDASSQFKEVF